MATSPMRLKQTLKFTLPATVLVRNVRCWRMFCSRNLSYNFEVRLLWHWIRIMFSQCIWLCVGINVGKRQYLISLKINFRQVFKHKTPTYTIHNRDLLFPWQEFHPTGSERLISYTSSAHSEGIYGELSTWKTEHCAYVSECFLIANLK